MKQLLTVLAVATLFASQALAVGTSHWKHTTAADFKAGTLHNVVPTNHGEIRLSRPVKTLLEQDPKVSWVHAMAEGRDGTVYAGTGPEGLLLAIRDDKVAPLLTIEGDDVLITALLVDAKGRLIIGTSGARGRVLVIDDPAKATEKTKPAVLLDSDDASYIWALAQLADGTLLAATGPNGKLFAITPDGKSSVLFSCNEHNLLSLATDGKDLVYVGTDPNGLVLRINRKTGEKFVLLDAAESEIASLALDAKGNLFAATGQAAESAGEGEAKETVGRPEPTTDGMTIPALPSNDPKPPVLPEPNPGEPGHTIPRSIVEPRDPSHPLGDIAPRSVAPATKPAVDKPVGTPTPTEPAAPAGGNAIYRIDAEGFVTEVFRESATIFSIIEQNGTLLVATGNEGTVYQVDPASEETVALAKVDPKDVMTLLPVRDGRVFLGLGNAGGIAAMSSGFAAEGAFTSPVLDATLVSRFGKLRLSGGLPAGTALTVATRSGNVAEPSDELWSRWSDEAPATRFLPVTAPSARFLQYRVTLRSTDGKTSPLVDEVDVAYQTPNVAPRIASIQAVLAGADESVAGALADAAKAAAKGDEAPSPVATVSWEASDANADALEYTLFVRALPAGKWVLLKDKLTEVTHDWNTRTVSDGRYELRVVASDARANAAGQGKTGSRVSEPVLVDNTPPVIGDLVVAQVDGKVTVSLKVVDRTSIVASVQYTVDSSQDWQTVLPSDTIFDSPEETVSFTVPGLKPGAHQVAIRATDGHGNRSNETAQVTVPDGK